MIRNTIRIVSFGYGHGEPPTADFTIDVRDSLRNPFGDDSLRELSAFDPAVLMHVKNTPGSRTIVVKVAALAMAFADVLALNFVRRDVTVAFGCVGGRHRSAALAMLLEDEIASRGVETEIEHRDIDRPLLPARVHETDR